MAPEVHEERWQTTALVSVEIEIISNVMSDRGAEPLCRLLQTLARQQMVINTREDVTDLVLSNIG